MHKLFCGAALLFLATHSGSASVGGQLYTGWTNSNLTITPYTPPPPPTTTGTYWSSTWLVEDWPRPVAVNGVVIAPVASLSLSVQAHAPAARHVAAATGEFFLLGQDGQVHAAPAQRPDQWHPLQAAVSAPGTDGFSLNDGVQLLTGDGFVSFDPGPSVLTPLADEPALDPAAHPVRFAPFSRIFVRPGTTYCFNGYRSGSGITGFHGRPNTGLTLPALYGDAVDAPRRAHSLRKIVQTGYTLFGLGELHPQTPGFAPGTQVLFKSVDSGITWVFQPLPAGGRWHDLAVNHTFEAWPHVAEANPVGTQIVLVGDDGIYTSRNDGQTWLHIRENITVATASPLPLVQPARTDAPLDEALTLRLNSVVWAKDRFIAAGRTQDGTGRPVFLEGLSKYWFAYPLAGWPLDRTVDEIVSYQSRRLFLSKGGEFAPLLAADVPVFASESQGDVPVLTAAPTLHPILGSYSTQSAQLTIHPSSTAVRRYVIESSDSTTWSVFQGRLAAPYSSVLANNVFLRDEPTRLTIVAINEFGRSLPTEVEVDPIRPPLLLQNPTASILSVSRVTVPFGGQVHIPVKHLNKEIPWDRQKTWFYGLPAGTSFDPSRSAIVGHALASGTHSVAILTIRGTQPSWTGPLTITIPEPAPKNLNAGVFSGILAGPDKLLGAWTVTLRADRSFTGQLRLTQRTYAIRGTLSAEPSLPNTYSALVSIPRKGGSALEVELLLHAADGRLALQVLDGESEATTKGTFVTHVPWAKDRHTPRAGDYSAAIRFTPEPGAPSAGQGFLRMQISTLGKATVRGELANGIKWTASGSLAADGQLPLFAKVPGARSLRGTLAFTTDSTTSTALRSELTWRGAADEKCPAYGAAATLSVGGDAAPMIKENRGSYIRWGRHDLTLIHPDLVRFGVENGEAKAPFDTYDSPKTVFDRYATDGNPLRMSLRLDRTTKLATGSLTVPLSAGRKLSLALRGAPVTDPETGETSVIGYFLLPAADGKTQLSGEVQSSFVGY